MKKILKFASFAFIFAASISNAEQRYFYWDFAGSYTNKDTGAAMTLGTNIVANNQTNTLNGTALSMPKDAEAYRVYWRFGPNASTATGTNAITLYMVAGRHDYEGKSTTNRWDSYIESNIKLTASGNGTNHVQTSEWFDARTIELLRPDTIINTLGGNTSNHVVYVVIRLRE